MSETTPQDTLPKGYEPKDIEDHWRAFWETNRTFTPTPETNGHKAEAYSIVIPPPNVTGNLHIGHALNLTLQDVLCRHARQLGKDVLWVPGEDHAGIATQNVVERRLAQEGKTRHDLGREKFIERVWQWKEEYGENIRRQIKAMGASVDWTRERFTMDEGLSRAVRRVFVRLYKEGLIYKGSYIINWCNRCHTALADDEVEHANQKTHLWHIRYPLEDGSGSLTIATTRPETMLGDTAVCVHPEDERYTALVGKKVRLPLTDRLIPVIADAYVDREFGTGALKVTPSHDHNDWHLGHKHNLEFLQVIDDEGCMNAEAGAYAGMPKEEARKKIAADLEAQGFLVQVADYENSVGHCYRCQAIIEPHVSPQWFVAVKTLAEKARNAVPDETAIYPTSWLKTYYNWLDNIRDWCISRQIWWGHRIPAWTCPACGEVMVEEEAPTTCCKCGSASLVQEDDVLDTWFSSALWPFSTMGWPDETAELKRYYPTSVLVTGFDILFFWVARMMMMGQHFMGQVPFKHVYIHALVRDAEGKKMSKSTGNVIDPLVMIDKYGTDSLRFTLTAFAAMGRDIRLSEDRIDGYRHFMNKIWNASRFALMNLEPGNAPQAVNLEGVAGLHHQWILHRLEELKTAQKEALAEYRFNDAAQSLYKFVWNEFCDWYLELIKPDMQAGGQRQQEARFVLWSVLRETLILLHPVTPFITSAVWQALPGHGEGANLAAELFPQIRPGCVRPAQADSMEMVQDVIIAVRTIRAELNISPSLRLNALVRPADAAAAQALEGAREMIMTLARLESLTLDAAAEAPKVSASQVARGNEIIVPLTGAVDFAAEVARIEKELGKMEKERGMLQGKLGNANYVEKAPAEVVERDRNRVVELADAIAKLQALKTRFQEAL
ncbi:valine--tRNA ligase [Desulfovibrio cuneatus]|uniref:valine--tRNA ligase n=1 Tax=Desulfovibrio cuneatus TaxID=159728 RepID=UPI000407881E|nr:valine--tRNA ligase [Desulfovibrio cuneatus]